MSDFIIPDDDILLEEDIFDSDSVFDDEDEENIPDFDPEDWN